MTTNPDLRLSNEQLDACAATLALMRELGPAHFDMDHWFRSMPDADDCTTTGELNGPGLPCNTAACLAGTAVWACQIPTVPFSATTPWWERDLLMQDRIRVVLGINIGYLEFGYDTDRDWFVVARWPRFASDELGRRWALLVEREGIDNVDIDFDANEVFRHRVEYDVVEWMLDDLVHGRRHHWWDANRYEPVSADD